MIFTKTALSIEVRTKVRSVWGSQNEEKTFFVLFLVVAPHGEMLADVTCLSSCSLSVFSSRRSVALSSLPWRSASSGGGVCVASFVFAVYRHLAKSEFHCLFGFGLVVVPF